MNDVYLDSQLAYPPNDVLLDQGGQSQGAQRILRMLMGLGL